MHERFLTEPRWHGIRFIKGLLDQVARGVAAAR